MTTSTGPASREYQSEITGHCCLGTDTTLRVRDHAAGLLTLVVSHSVPGTWRGIHGTGDDGQLILPVILHYRAVHALCDDLTQWLQKDVYADPAVIAGADRAIAEAEEQDTAHRQRIGRYADAVMGMVAEDGSGHLSAGAIHDEVIRRLTEADDRVPLTGTGRDAITAMGPDLLTTDSWGPGYDGTI